MARTALGVFLCLGLLPVAAVAGDRPEVDPIRRTYAPEDLESGAVQVSVTLDAVYVSGVSERGPWFDVWQRREGEWVKVAEVVFAELKPVRFGVRRGRTCGRAAS